MEVARTLRGPILVRWPFSLGIMKVDGLVILFLASRLLSIGIGRREGLGAEISDVEKGVLFLLLGDLV